MPSAMDGGGTAWECRGLSGPVARHGPGAHGLPARSGPGLAGAGRPLPGDLPRAPPLAPHLRGPAARRALALCDRGARRGPAHAPAPDPDQQGGSRRRTPRGGDGGGRARAAAARASARSTAADPSRGDRAREARRRLDQGGSGASWDDTRGAPRTRPPGVLGAAAPPRKLKDADASDARAPGRPAHRRRPAGASALVAPHATGPLAGPTDADARGRRRVRAAPGPGRSPSSAALPARRGSAGGRWSHGSGGGAARRGARDGERTPGGGGFAAARLGSGGPRVART